MSLAPFADIQFRPPYGAYNNLVLQVAAERGYTKMVLWTDDTGDSTGASMQSQQAVMDGVVQSFPSPRMVLQHSTVDSGESSLFFKSFQTAIAGWR